MNKWLVLLRGINVSGQKKIVMAELRELLTANGFGQVVTYIQSGNIIVDLEEEMAQLAIETKVKRLIHKNYGFDVDVFARAPAWFKSVAQKNPYLNKPAIDRKQLYLTILDQVPTRENIRRLDDFNTTDDEYVIRESVIYIHYPNGAGKARLTNNLIESKLKVKATSRNWNTTLKLIELSS